MSSIKPEAGMTYEFEVEGVFYFKNGSVVITGTTPSNYSRLHPAIAEVFVNENSIGTLSITEEMYPHILDPSRTHIKSLVTYDKLDLKPYLSSGISLRCVFTEKLSVC